LAGIPTIMQAQRTKQHDIYTELGINISSVLSTFVGNSSDVFSPDDYPFMAKFHRKNIIFRLGFGALVNQLQEDSRVDMEAFQFSDVNIRTRYGLEKQLALNSSFDFYYGLDLLVQWDYDYDVTSTVFDVTTISVSTFSAGIGPVYGFTYQLGKRVKLGTEGSFYNVYSYGERKERFEFNTGANKERIIQGFNSNITVPVHLYVLVRL
jgi:hypothetical protein